MPSLTLSFPDFFCPFFTWNILTVFFPVVNLLKISTLSFEGSIGLCNLEVLNKAVTSLVLVYNANWHKDSNLIPFFYWNIVLVLTLDLIYRGCILSVIASQCQFEGRLCNC